MNGDRSGGKNIGGYFAMWKTMPFLYDDTGRTTGIDEVKKPRRGTDVESRGS